MNKTKPCRIQRKRTKGWKMPANTVYVGRPTKWGNPSRVGIKYGYGSQAVGFFESELSAADCVNLFVVSIENGKNPSFDCSELKGKNLACWCSLDMPCHADVLLEIANE